MYEKEVEMCGELQNSVFACVCVYIYIFIYLKNYAFRISYICSLKYTNVYVRMILSFNEFNATSSSSIKCCGMI